MWKIKFRFTGCTRLSILDYRKPHLKTDMTSDRLIKWINVVAAVLAITSRVEGLRELSGIFYYMHCWTYSFAVRISLELSRIFEFLGFYVRVSSA